ncbi:MAG: cupin domain-containing protein [Leptolyngbyaceae cyanobacterium MO_188.B28]|nr:cupin domain-containing protein [Leptolyngbyaceae cyanobacterium MO_188.B28]
MGDLTNKHNLISLAEGIVETCKTHDIGQFNGNSVRLRVMEDVTANWHSHNNSDELFYVISGEVHIDSEIGTQSLNANELYIVPAKMRYRARVEGRAALLVIDSIK